MDNSTALQSLKHVAWLDGLGEDLLAEVMRAGRFKRYGVRQEVISRGDVDRDCFIVLSGRLGVIAWSPSGRQVSFRDVHAGQLVGELAAIDGRPRSATVVALSETLVLRMTPETLTSLFQQHWPICERMLKHLAASARDMSERVYELSALSVRQRLCAELLRLTLDSGRDGDTPVARPAPSHHDLASRIGSERAHVTRELAKMEGLGLIERIDGRISIPDLQRLADAIEVA